MASLTKDEFIASGDSRETSPELMEAIWFAASGSAPRAEIIWRDGANESEMVCIVERATKNGLIDTSDLCWGTAGSNWAG